MATLAQRRHLHGAMEYLLAHEPRIHYAQVRPMQTIHYTEQQVTRLLDHGGSITMDCSEAVTCLCKWAGLHDPNGLHYNGSGYTGTMLAHLPHYTNPKAAQTGALVVFGPGSGEHVCMVQEPGGDPLLWSHGAERGPRSVRFTVERAFHAQPATFLSIAHL
jgi:hypothetical protein